jgi:hypothetical protein
MKDLLTLVVICTIDALLDDVARKFVLGEA